MFINLIEFKKLLKNAYKGGGLIVGRLEEDMVLTNGSGTWGVQVEAECVPNKLKGALVELIGDLPEYGEVCRYSPEGIQTELNLGRFDFKGLGRQRRITQPRPRSSCRKNGASMLCCSYIAPWK